MQNRVWGVLALLALGLAGCINIGGWRTVSGSGQIQSDNRAVSQFDTVSIGGSGQVTIVQGQEESLSVETDDNFLPLIKSEVNHGHLRIGPDQVNLRPTRTIRYHLQVKDLKALSLSGSLKAQAESIKTDHLDLRISGSGKIQIAQLHANSLSARISGSGDTIVAGEVDRQDVDISGSGNHEAVDLRCRQTEARISGSGHATVWVKDSLTAHISGSGSVDCYGHPHISSHVSGSGRVRRHDDK